MNLDSNELDFTCLLDDQPGLEQDLSLPGTDLGPPVGQSGPGPTGPNQGRPNQEHDSYYTDQRQGKSATQKVTQGQIQFLYPQNDLGKLH